LDRVNGPNDLHSFSLDELEQLAEEIRQRIIETVMVNGGHLASSLGVVELTLALHHVFDLERDWIVWDVGHQSYAHKLLTGRRDRFDTLRVKDGLSGYPRRAESPYDVFGAGHSSTSISAALGMAVARDYFSEDRRVIAVIGDGAMTGGMAWEALSHAGHLGSDLLVILNDNKMSIAENVGALSEYFSRLITGHRYKRAKEDVASFVKTLIGPRLSQTAHRLEQSVKGFITAGGVFQELGFNYIGPVDGHDLPVLAGMFSNLKKMRGPILFHCVTQKGKGFTEAENDPLKYHGVKPSKGCTIENEGEARVPEKVPPARPAKTFTDVFAEALIDISEKDPTVVGITAAMPTGTGLHRFKEVFPERYYDVGICEQHAITFAAGLAAQGMRPVCAIYSTFLQRGYDQVVHDVCLQNLPVVFAIDRAGVVGEDGPTHAGSFDLTFLRALPNLSILTPRDDCDLRAMLRWALVQPGPVATRYPRDTAVTVGNAGPSDISHAEILRPGADAMFLAAGSLVRACLKAAELIECEGWSVGVADARWIKPLDGSLLDTLVSMPLVTVEENALMGGFGSAVLEYYADTGRLAGACIRRAGLPDVFGEHATRAQQLAECNLEPRSLAEMMCKMLRCPRGGSALFVPHTLGPFSEQPIADTGE